MIMPQGAALVDLVIERVRASGFGALGRCGPPDVAAPRPVPADRLAALTFPGGRPLPPSLLRWLAFDAAWLDWFSPDEPAFARSPLAGYVTAEFDALWGGIYAILGRRLLTGDCYGLHFGSDSRRFIYVGQADSLGEYPVLMLDIDDLPYMAVEYPGFDVYLAAHAGLLADSPPLDATHPVFGPRYREHAQRNMGGLLEFELGVDLWFDDQENIVRPGD